MEHDFLEMTAADAEEFILSKDLPKYRAKQILEGVYKGKRFSEMQNLPRALRDMLAECCADKLPSIETKLVSEIDGTVKYLFRLFDGEFVESVVMDYKYGKTICISSEVGCPMGCKFCASTIGGKIRNLSASELMGQIVAAQADIGERISGVVMMGIGEPLDNYDNVIKFLRLVSLPETLCIGARHISLSTSGIVPKINQLAKEDLQITLSISLHACDDETRSAIMPVNKKWGIDELLSACKNYFDETGRRISFEYTLIDGKNDGESDALRLASLMRKYFGKEPVHINLIPVNEVKETGFRKSSAARVEAFKQTLLQKGLNATVRRKLGQDINASCGQLRAKKLEG